jgi:hypothetical protein
MEPVPNRAVEGITPCQKLRRSGAAGVSSGWALNCIAWGFSACGSCLICVSVLPIVSSSVPFHAFRWPMAVMRSPNSLARLIPLHRIDQDGKALAHAGNLLRDFSDRVTFEQANVLKWRSEDKYDLVWSAGLFDYPVGRAFREGASQAPPKLQKKMARSSSGISPSGTFTAPTWNSADGHLRHRKRSRALGSGQARRR